MIGEVLFSIFAGLLSGFLSLFPPMAWNLTAATAIGNVAARAGLWNGYFPVQTLALCLGLVLTLRVFMSGYRLVLFVYHQF